MEKLVKFNKLSPIQPENIWLISVTLKVVKFIKFKDFNEEQSLNIYFMLVTLDVSKLDKFKFVIELHLENIYSISSMNEVLNFSTLIELKEEQP